MSEGGFETFEAVVVALFGLIFGSFANVLIHRLPRREPIGAERSRCPRCGHPIAWYHNVPLLSYVWLRGRCASCRAWISPRYPLVEATSAALVVLTWVSVGRPPLATLGAGMFLALGGLALAQAVGRRVPAETTVPGTWVELHLVVGAVVFAAVELAGAFTLGLPPFWVFVPFAVAMVVLFVVDLEHQLLPDAVTVTGTIYGMAIAPFNPRFAAHAATWQGAVARSAAGAALGFGLLWLLAAGYRRVRGVTGLGGGDLKLAALVGAFSGSEGVVAVLLIGSVAGVIFGLSLVAMRRAGMQSVLPFGCFLAPAAFIVVVLGHEDLWQLWLSLVRYHYLRLVAG